jgi:tRNA U34 2-thiouridine synthase MnmA/TrmU
MSHAVAIHPALKDRLRGEVPPRLDEDGRPVRALLMYSGGLDSTLAGILLRLQGIDVVAVNMFTGFCLTDHKRKMGRSRPDGSRYQNEAIVGAAGLEIPVEVVDVREGYLKVLTEPTYGWGSAVNPCIDCRIHMFGHARRELLEEYGAHFLATGEVLGQRPMTQQRRQMRLIEEETGLLGLIVRPLCQAVLPISIPEQRGWVDRERLLAITGRGRKPQIQLARELGVLDYPQPAGGCCFLTDGNYGKRLRDVIDHKPKAEIRFEDVLVLKLGRHFRLPGGSKLVVGRNEDENEMLRGYWALGRFLQVRDFSGPLALLLAPQGGVGAPGAAEDRDFDLALRIVARYSDCPKDESREVELEERRGDEPCGLHRAAPLPPGRESEWMIV